MSSTEIRLALHKYIDQADDRFVGAVYAMVQQYMDQDEIIVYSTDGKPLTQKQMAEEVQAAYADVKKGNFKTTAQVREEIKKWTKP